jgi:hypothetical protein
MEMIADIRMAMAVSLFVLGLCSCVAGIWTILSRKYQQALRNVSAHSAQVSSKAIGDVALAPLVDSISGLIRALDQLVRTSIGIGVFLCLAGMALCAVGFWMLNGL